MERGAQTPRYLAVKEDKDNYWILQEAAKGRNDIPNEDVGEYFSDLIKAPDEQYKNLLITIKELFDFDLEIRTTNIFYDKDIGFTVIDIGKSPEKFFNEHNINDINSLISYADTAISSLYYFASFCGEIMPPQNQFEREFITYRLLKVVREFISNIDIEMSDKLKFEYSDNEEIFDIFEAKIKELDEITPQKLEELVNIIFEQYPENKIILRNQRRYKRKRVLEEKARRKIT